ncbi:MAG: Gx transporter family protein [Treponema sp.]|nr:Gx transporter family protein [Treponema sp.]
MRPGKAPDRFDPFGHTVALLGAFCLFLSTLEYMVPKPIPFIRIGLANVPLLIALDIFPWRVFAFLALLKVLGQALITGVLFSYVFLLSLVGTCASAAAMYLLARCLDRSRIGFTGIGVTGALVSNLSQLFLARFFILGAGVKFLLPPFLISGMLTGTALGLFCEAFTARSAWYRRARGLAGQLPLPPGGISPGETPPEEPPPRNIPPRAAERRFRELFSSRDLCITGLFMTTAFLCNPSTPLRCLQFLFFWFLAFLGGKKNNTPMTLAVILGIVFFNLLIPYGKVLAEAGPFRLTQGSLLSGIRKAVTLEGLIMLSRVSIRPDLRLPGRFGALLGESFRILEEILRRKGIVTRKKFMEGLDQLMTELSAEARGHGEKQPAPSPEPERKLPGLAFLAAAALLTAGCTAAGLITDLLPRF